MDGSATRMSEMGTRDQLLKQIQAYQTNQARVNNGIGRLTQMDTAMITPLVRPDYHTQHNGLCVMIPRVIHQMVANARRLQVYDIPAEPISIILALSDLTTVAHLKSTARHFTNAIRPIIRNIRLPNAIEGAGASGVVQFDPQLSHGDVMKAMWVVEEGGEGGWGEVGDTLRVAEYCGNCQLPITVDGADLQTHATKAPNFTITLNPPLPLPTDRPVHAFSQHPFQQHAKPHDPPVRSRIGWQHGVGWVTIGVNDGPLYASASSMLKDLVLCHRLLALGGSTDSPAVAVDRRVRGGHLDRIMTQSPHTPPNGCSNVLTWEAADGICAQLHVLTSSNDPFLAEIAFGIFPGDNQSVRVIIRTTEAPAAAVPQDAPFAQRFLLTAAKVRCVLGPIASIVLDGQAP
ncbi:unnamed protein product [Vitrella brassicaformis CCMP3155]|uniref:Uncharacterized protein n=1 Tax=Vitrella brassicaformis (strain CCMP3155) TaxID=1169540 RepID=A0A0G4GG74_VITBC|nr:unnamed protein product [Vitrella brassicaformis CCMP3155]|eukprot:CEM28615.1 unnamed protein product [Vitrella brassicaformis CCMP3155]